MAYGKEYWIKKGYSEEYAINRSKGLINCDICSCLFLKKDSKTLGSNICSSTCLDKSIANRIAKYKETRKSLEKQYTCEVCQSPVTKSNSKMTCRFICSDD